MPSRGPGPQWLALAREAAIGAEHVGIGVTALGRANYAQHAYYGQAFFALSIGFERSAKLALVIDHTLDHAGTFPGNTTVKAYGHSITKLLRKMDEISSRRNIGLDAAIPSTPIHKSIIEVLSDFATNITRYYNLDFITGDSRAKSIPDPTATWWTEVTAPIARAHYSTKRRSRDEHRARQVQQLIGHVMHVRMTSPSGTPLLDAGSAAQQSALTEATRPYERMYVLQIARSIAAVMSHLSWAAHGAKLDSPELSEFYGIYNNPDRYLKQRKVWSIY